MNKVVSNEPKLNGKSKRTLNTIDKTKKMNMIVQVITDE